MQEAEALAIEFVQTMARMEQIARRTRSLEVDQTHGLSRGSFHILRTLHKTEIAGEQPLTPQALATRLSRSLPSLTRALGELEQKGDIVRTPHAQDRRMVCVSLTEQGRSITEAAWKDMVSHIAQLLGHMGLAQGAELIKLMQQACQGLETICEEKLHDQIS